MARDVAQSTHRAQHLIEALLVLARSEQRVTDIETDDLADVAAEAMDRITAQARLRGLRVAAGLAAAPFRGNIALLGIAVTNLLENAVKYNRDQGVLHVATRRVSARTPSGRCLEWAGSPSPTTAVHWPRNNWTSCSNPSTAATTHAAAPERPHPTASASACP